MLQFIDSLQFLQASLDTLVKNLKSGGSDKFKVLKSEFPDPTELDLVLRKGIFPYDFITGLEKLETTHLPPATSFHNKLTKTDITPAEYQHCQNIWSTLNMTSMEEYMRLYVKTDVLLLADIMINMRESFFDHFGVDALWFFGIPGLS